MGLAKFSLKNFNYLYISVQYPMYWNIRRLYYFTRNMVLNPNFPLNIYDKIVGWKSLAVNAVRV